MKREIGFTLNGEAVRLEVEDQWTLLYLLREVLEMTGTKEGCGYGECGACTVIIDGKAINSCLYPAMEAEGRAITTIEGLVSKDGELHPLQTLHNEGRAWVWVLYAWHDYVPRQPSMQMTNP